MRPSSGKPWEEYAVGKPSDTSGWSEPDCQLLDTIYHVAHVPAATRILEDDRFRADLVYDKSKLNKARIRVVWLSPNHWVPGFRYGNIRFAFDWRDLISEKRYYWVESIAYGVPAYRILVTDADYSSALPVYDPTIGDGPWWHDKMNDKHYWNGEYCFEVMHEGDLLLPQATSLDFVDHHSSFCSILPHDCKYCGWPHWKGGAEFIAAVASQGRRIVVPGLLKEGGGRPGLRPSSALEAAFFYILKQLDNCTITDWGSVPGEGSASVPLARAVLGAIARSDGDGLSQLLRLFRSKDDAELGIAAAVAADVGLPDPKRLLA